MRTTEQERYEGIFRAVNRRPRNALILCLGITAVLAFSFGLVTAYFSPILPAAWPDWFRFVALVVPAFIVIGIIPTAAQLLYIGESGRRSVEAVNGWGIPEAQRYFAETGTKFPTIGSRKAALRWLATGQGQGTRLRVRVLLWAGQLAEAASAVNDLPSVDPYDAFHRDVLIELVRFVATGSMDLTAPRAAFGAIPEGSERDTARLTLAFEEARLEHARGGTWLDILVAARAQVERLPRGASIRERVLASVPTTIGTFAVIALAVWFSRGS